MRQRARGLLTILVTKHPFGAVPLLRDPSSIFASRTEAGAMVRLQPRTLADALKGSGDAPALILAGTMRQCVNRESTPDSLLPDM